MLRSARRVKMKMQVKNKTAARIWVDVTADVEHSDRLPGKSHLNETTNSKAPKKWHLSALCPDASQTVPQPMETFKESLM